MGDPHGRADRHRGQTDPALLASCFTRSLEVAADVGARSVAFPAVSAGVYGWDAHEVATIAVTTVRAWVADHPGDLDLVRFLLFGPAVHQAFVDALAD